MAKVLLVTGSSRGLGRHVAEPVLTSFHPLVATACRPGSLIDLVSRYGCDRGGPGPTCKRGEDDLV
jgi:NAD(P)-dependent dehydrogenase (short-subunit alcohol dehydrogenase family)